MRCSMLLVWYIGNKSLHAGEGESAEPTDERSQVLTDTVLDFGMFRLSRHARRLTLAVRLL